MVSTSVIAENLTGKVIAVLVMVVVLFFVSCNSSDKGAADPVIVYRSEDSLANYYLALHPVAKPKGLFVVLPGFSTLPEAVLTETDLPTTAQRDGYLVVIPYLNVNTFYTDTVSQERLKSLLWDVIREFEISPGKVILGGHSAGGNGALLYAERAVADKHWDAVVPKAVFGVDPPLDMKRLWNSFKWTEQIKTDPSVPTEGSYFMARFRADLGGSPEEFPAEYQKISSYYRDAPDGGNVRHLRKIPVRLYCDPDVNWYIEQRNLPIELANLSDLSACIVQLRLLGNDQAELIVNPGKGFRPDGTRHPHAFSQLDAGEFLRWTNNLLR